MSACERKEPQDHPDPPSGQQQRILFPPDSVPPWSLVGLYGVQIVLSTLSGPVTAAFVIGAMVCAQDDKIFLSQLISTTVFMNGLCTLLQVTFGVRLPIVQGSCFNYLAIIASMMNTPLWRCPEYPISSAENVDIHNDTATIGTERNMTSDKSAIWKSRLLEASGALIVSSAVQVLLGCSGLIGFVLRFIGPLTIAPTMIFVGLSQTYAIIANSKQHWGVAAFTAAIFLIVYSFMKNIQVPFPTCDKMRGCRMGKYPLFRLFPQFIAIILGWSLCGILTATNVLPDMPGTVGYRARTDTNLQLILDVKWFSFPYPGMWGLPTISLSTFFGMLAATICSIIESVGDYYATARACNVRPPPKHAVNRGIAMEGFGGILCGLFGAGHATTSYSESIGYISLTGMASRMTWQLAGCVFMIAGIFGKFGAILACIPDPVIGGIMMVGLGIVISVGLSTLEFVDLGSSRNHVVLGLAILVGTAIPKWIDDTPNAIHTGNATIDEILTIFLRTSMLVAGTLAFTLDNLLPGTPAERGLTAYSNPSDIQSANVQLEYVKTEGSDFQVPTGSTNDTALAIYNLPSIRCRIWRRFDTNKPYKQEQDQYQEQDQEPEQDNCVVNVPSCLSHFLTYLPFLPCYVDRSCNSLPRTSSGCSSNVCRATKHSEINMANTTELILLSKKETI